MSPTPLKDRTKQLYADTLRALLKTRSFEEVRVADICRESGTNRATFYYHFRDKYDLTAWVYTQTMDSGCREQGRRLTVEVAAASLAQMWGEADFYKNVFTHRSQNALWEYIVEYNTRMFEEICLRQTGAEPEAALRFAIRYHCYACIGLTTDWLMGKLPLGATDLAAQMIARMPEDLKAVVC